MATLYAKTAGGNWSAASTWSATSASGVDNAGPPTAATDVIFELASGNVTIDTSPVCRSLDCTSGTGTYAGVLTHNASTTLTIGDATAGAGNVALKLTAGMTYTLNNAASSAISFVSSSATVQTITTAGKSLASITFNGSTGSWQFSDNFTQGSGASITLTQGTLDTNGKTCSWGVLSTAGALLRTLTLGSSAITLTGASTSVLVTSGSNLTITANTATMTSTGAAATLNTLAINYNGLSFVASGSGVFTFTGASGATLANFTRTGTAVKTDSLSIAVVFTVTGTTTLTGNSATNRLLVQASTVGTSRSITSAVASLTNVDFQDIQGAGAATWSGTSIGDCGGNSGITFTVAAAQTHTASAGGNWSDVTKWTSRVPLPQDNVIVDVNTTGTLTADMPRIGANIDFTGFAGTINFGGGVVNNSLYGSLTLSSGLTTAGTLGLVLASRSSSTVTSAGRTFTQAIVFSGPGGTYTLQDALISAGTLNITDGTFTANNFNVTATTLTSTSGRTRTINMGSGTWTLTGTGTVWNVTSTALTFNANTSTISVTDTSATTKTLNGSTGMTYYNWNFAGGKAGTIVWGLGSSTVNGITAASGLILQMPAASTTTIASGGTFNVNGAVNGYEYLPGVAANYISTPDSAALSVTGDITLDAKLAMDDWTPAAAQVIAAKWGTNGLRSYELYVNTNGTLQFVLSQDGTANTNVASSVATGVADGAVKWVRVTWRASDGRVQFFTSDDGSSFSQLGTNQTIALASIHDNTQILEIGTNAIGTAFPIAGKIYQVRIYSDITQTTKVFDANFTAKTVGANSFTESSSNAATVTINGTLAQVGDGRVSLVSSTPGTQATLSKATGVVSVNYLSIQDSNATGGAGWYAGANSVNVSNNTGWHFTGLSTPTPSQFFNLFD